MIGEVNTWPFDIKTRSKFIAIVATDLKLLHLFHAQDQSCLRFLSTADRRVSCKSGLSKTHLSYFCNILVVYVAVYRTETTKSGD